MAAWALEPQCAAVNDGMHHSSPLLQRLPDESIENWQ
jgi:hypothetical protein